MFPFDYYHCLQIVFFSFEIDRSIIRLPDVTNSTQSDRTLINIAPQIRTIDVRNSVEYRDLEKKNKELLAQNNSLKQALKKMKVEQRTFEKTHMSKLIIKIRDMTVPIRYC